MKIRDIYNIINEEFNNIVIDDDKMRDEYLRKFNYFSNKDLDDLTLVHIFKWLRILGINNSNKKYGNILDLGCGWGKDTIILSMFNFENVVGVDVFKDRIDIANMRVKYHSKKNNTNSKIKIYYENFLNYNTKHKEQYDIIYCYDVLTHIHPVDIALECIYKSLKPGGIFVSGDLNINNPISYFKFKKLFTSRYNHFNYGFVHETCKDPKTGEAVLMAEEAIMSNKQYNKMATLHGFKKVEYIYPFSFPSTIVKDRKTNLLIGIEQYIENSLFSPFFGREKFVKMYK